MDKKPISAPVTDIGNRRQFWFNAQDLVQEAKSIRILQ